MKHQAKKRFGQNFLIDQSIIQQLISAIHPQANDLMVEIGPGLGALTKPLLAALNHLHLIEIDRDIIQWMRQQYPAEKITIHESDVLKFDFARLKQDNQKLRIVGNLPYNISSPILFHLLPHLAHIQDMHFMLQKEVVERMVAAPSSSEYGRLSVMLQYALQMEYLVTVPGEAFDPAPKVESAFVRCVPHATLPYVAHDTDKFARVVTAAFSQRRKTIRNTLKPFLNDEDYKSLNIDSQLRAENLSVAEFVQISNYLD
jgi:16S rRNA (adenine1518-N6/adenine1519-N6)-dimethyltransferase